MKKYFPFFSGLAGRLVIVALVVIMSGCRKGDERSAAVNDRETRAPNTAGIDATLRSFARVAGYDWNAVMEMTALPSVATEWQNQNAGIFESSINSYAFFRNPFFLMSGEGKGRWIGGIYNLWIDKWLLLEFVWQSDIRADRITGFAWLDGGDATKLSQRINADDMPRRLQNRLDKAVETGRVGAFKLLEGQSDDPMFLRTPPATELEEYVARMRAALATDGSPSLSPLRLEMDRFYEQMEAGEQEWAADINERIELASMLTPDFLSVQDDTATIVMSAYPNPYLFVLAQFEVKSPKPVFQGIDFYQLSLDKEEEQ